MIVTQQRFTQIYLQCINMRVDDRKLLRRHDVETKTEEKKQYLQFFFCFDFLCDVEWCATM